MSKTLPMFELAKENKSEDEWVGMPDYNNLDYPEPAVIVTFKFLTQEDYQAFYELIKEKIFNGEKPFDGRQEKNSKTAWYPPKEKASNYVYVSEDES